MGDRVQVNVRLPADLRTRIDDARGTMSRDSWMERAAELALRPAAAIVDPELAQKAHKHTFVMLKSSNIGPPAADGTRRRYRTYACACGAEEERDQ